MMLEGSFAEDLSHMQNRKPAAPHIFRSILFHKKKIGSMMCWLIDTQPIIKL